MTINYASLAAEITNDPAALGYAPHVASGNDGAIANILNGLTGGSSIEVEFANSTALQACVVASEYNALTQAQRDLWQAIITSTPVPIKNAGFRAQIAAIWGAPTATRAALIALQSKSGTRAEALFGENTVVTPADVAKALRG